MLRLRPVCINWWRFSSKTRLGEKLSAINAARNQRKIDNGEVLYLEKLSKERLKENAEKRKEQIKQQYDLTKTKTLEKGENLKVKTLERKEHLIERRDEFKEKTREKREHLIERKDELKTKTREKTREVRERAKRENWYTTPNAMSASRLLISPVIYNLIMRGNYEYALYLNIYGGLSDFADGKIARTWPSQQSSLGSALDPLADKVTMLAIYLAFYARGDIPPWLFWMFIGRDILLIAAGSYMRYTTLPAPRTAKRYFDGALVTIKFHPTWISKSNTVLQFLLSYWIMAHASGVVAFDSYTPAFMYLTAATTAISCGEYFLLRRDLTTWKKVYERV